MFKITLINENTTASFNDKACSTQLKRIFVGMGYNEKDTDKLTSIFEKLACAVYEVDKNLIIRTKKQLSDCGCGKKKSKKNKEEKKLEEETNNNL